MSAGGMRGGDLRLTEAPRLGPLLALGAVRGVLPGRQSNADAALPGGAVVLDDARTDPARLAAYARVCGYALRDRLPATWLHVLTFPLQVALMSEPGFPFPLAGLVHTENAMTVHRPALVTDALALIVRAENARPHRKGREFDLVGEVRVAGELVWSGRSTYLAPGAADSGTVPEEPARGTSRASRRGEPHSDEAAPAPIPEEPARGTSRASRRGEPHSDEAAPAPIPEEPARGTSRASRRAEPHSEEEASRRDTPRRSSADADLAPVSQRWRLPADLGRRYAAVSGDVNPIHLYPATARLFGYKRPLVHGMWTHARALAALEPRLPESYTVSVQFIRPLLLPTTAGFAASGTDDGVAFAVLRKDGKPALLGEVTAG